MAASVTAEHEPISTRPCMAACLRQTEDTREREGQRPLYFPCIPSADETQHLK